MGKKSTPVATKPPSQPQSPSSGHSHNGQACNHNHGNTNSSPQHNHQDQNDQDFDDDDYEHSGPTQIPYYIVTGLILSIWFLYLATHFIFEDRPQILLQGTHSTLPYVLPEWLPYQHNSIIRTIYHFTPFSLHPFQWITFIFISYCFFVSFIRVTYTNPGCVDQFDPIWAFHKQPAQIQQQLHYQTSQYHLSSILPPTVERKHNGARRYCRKTNAFKPDRSHFCHATNRLVKRLDHYCIFLSASVGYNNHKYFILFLFWVIILGLFIGLKVIFPLEFIWRLNGIHMIINLLLACFGTASALALSGFLGFHLWLIANSLTTIESGEKFNKYDPVSGLYKQSPYNVTLLSNFQQVFGIGPILTWFLPIHPTRHNYEDGTVFPVAYQCHPCASITEY